MAVKLAGLARSPRERARVAVERVGRSVGRRLAVLPLRAIVSVPLAKSNESTAVSAIDRTDREDAPNEQP